VVGGADPAQAGANDRDIEMLHEVIVASAAREQCESGTDGLALLRG
jgi:hypothetical protein